MTFDEDKKAASDKTDRSKKGSIDEKISPLCELINSFDEYYTTSSCSGRIVLRKVSGSGKKCETEWLFTTHDIADFKVMKTTLLSPPEEQVWFGFDPIIMHIACKDMDSASMLLRLMRDAGFKRTGIISTERIVVEIIGNERLEAPVSEKGALVVTEEYLQFLMNAANRKMVRNEERIDRLFRSFLRFQDKRA